MNNSDQLNWCGVLTVDNIKDVATLLRQLIDGKRYTFVSINMRDGDNPNPHVPIVDVLTSQRASRDMNGETCPIWFDDKSEPPRFAGIRVDDTHGSWALFTRTDETEYEHEFNNPYISFETNRVTISHHAPDGHELYWAIVIDE